MVIQPIMIRIATCIYFSRHVFAWTLVPSGLHHRCKLFKLQSMRYFSDSAPAQGESSTLPRFWTKRLSIPVPNNSQALQNTLKGLGFDMSQIVSGSLVFPRLGVSFPIYDGRLQLQLGVNIEDSSVISNPALSGIHEQMAIS